MVIDINRLFPGIFLIVTLLLCFILKFDYLILISLFSFVLYDLYKSHFINSFYDSLIIILFILILPILYFEDKLINILNILLILCVFLNLFFHKFYFKKAFLISSLIFMLNFFSIFNINRELLYFVIFIAFFNDTIAYITGKYFKGPLIIPNVSPNKTWSGTISSFFLSLFVIYQFNINFLVAIILSLSLFFGDIYFSYIKRKSHLKDFSSLLRGHGGMLDRLDSMFFFIIIFNLYNFL